MRKTGQTKEELIKEVKFLKSKIQKLEQTKSNLRKSESIIRDQTETIRAIVETSQDWIWSVNIDGIHTYSNNAVEAILGFSNTDIVGKSFNDFIHPEDKKEINQLFPRWIKEKSGWKRRVIRWKHKNGSWRTLESSAVPVFDDNNNIIGFRGVDRDISDRIDAKREIQHSKDFIETALDAQIDTFFLLDPSTSKAISWNKAFRELSGYTDDEISQNPAPASYYSSEDLEKASETINRALAKGEATIEMNLICKNGKKIPTEYRVSVIKDQVGNPKYLVSIGRDITKRIEAENKLKQEMIFNETLLQTSSAFIVAINREGKVIMANKSFLDVLGYKLEDFVGIDYMDTVVPEREHENLSLIFNKIISNPEQTCNRNHIIDKDGKEILVEWFGKSVMNENNVFEYFFGFGIDITERNQIEIALKESETNYSSIVNSSPMGMHMYELDEEDRLIFTGANSTADKLLAVDNKQFIGKTIEQAFPPLADTEIPERYRLAAGKGESWRTEQISYDHGLIMGAFEVHAFQTLPGKMVAMFLEITERKKSEEILRQNNYIVSSTSDLMALIDDNYVYLSVNQAYMDAFKLDEDQIIGKNVTKILGKAVFTKFVKPNADLCMTGQQTNYKEWLILPKYGKCYMDINYYPYYNDKNEVKGFVVSSRDITEQKKSQEALLDSEERLKIIFELAPDAIYLNDSKGNFLDGNKAAENMLGFKREELIGKSFVSANILAVSEIPKALKLLSKNLRGSKTGPDEIVLVRKDGTKFSAEVSTFPVKIKGKKVILGIARDITQRKKSEAKLIESEEKFKVIAEQSMQGISIANGQAWF